jgi:anaerobic dimethyl sulfoxide reductase subunit B (iron-sulfur subunit)
MHIVKDGSVQPDPEICIGCKSCMKACPYEVPQYFEDKEIVQKCDMCIDLRARGERPVCVDACPQFALEWGELDDLVVKHPDAVKDIPILPHSSQTDPSTIISPRKCALEEEFRQKFI